MKHSRISSYNFHFVPCTKELCGNQASVNSLERITPAYLCVPVKHNKLAIKSAVSISAWLPSIRVGGWLLLAHCAVKWLDKIVHRWGGDMLRKKHVFPSWSSHINCLARGTHVTSYRHLGLKFKKIKCIGFFSRKKSRPCAWNSTTWSPPWSLIINWG